MNIRCSISVYCYNEIVLNSIMWSKTYCNRYLLFYIPTSIPVTSHHVMPKYGNHVTLYTLSRDVSGERKGRAEQGETNVKLCCHGIRFEL